RERQRMHARDDALAGGVAVVFRAREEARVAAGEVLADARRRLLPEARAADVHVHEGVPAVESGAAAVERADAVPQRLEGELRRLREADVGGEALGVHRRARGALEALVVVGAPVAGEE